MEKLRGLHLLVVLGMVMFSAGVFTPFVDAQTIYALLLIDDGNPKNFQQHKTSHTRMRNLLNKIENTLGIAVETKVLQTSGRSRTSPDFPTLKNIGKWIDTVNVDANDVVFIYASSHGGANRQTRELYLSFSGVKVERPTVTEALDALQCRLKLLVTDACNYGVEITQSYVNPGLPVAYRHLFLEHRGFLNLASATEGEYAGGDDKGGWFTVAFVEVLEAANNYDTNGDAFVSWEEIFVGVKQETEKIFDVRKHDLPANWKKIIEDAGQESQRPKYFGDLPQRED